MPENARIITEFVTPAGPFGFSCFLIGFSIFLLILVLVIEQCGGFEE